MKFGRQKGIVSVVMIVSLIGMLLASGLAGAASVEPILIKGNATCAQLAPGTTELKVEPVSSGTYSDGTLTVTITVYDTDDGQVFDFTSNLAVDAVFVKGGPNGNLYVYDPEVSSDTALHAPINPDNNHYYGLSHISFCYVTGFVV